MLRCHNQHDNLVFLDASETECNGKAKMKGVGVGEETTADEAHSPEVVGWRGVGVAMWRWSPWLLHWCCWVWASWVEG